MALELYHKMPCPYSKKVRDFISENRLNNQIEYHDILKDESAVERLVSMTGRKTVPVLVVDGRPIPESDEIVKFLQSHFGATQDQASV